MFKYEVLVKYQQKTEQIKIVTPKELTIQELRQRINRAISRNDFTFEVLSYTEHEMSEAEKAFFKMMRGDK